MDVILVPGLWLDASSWNPVIEPLRTAGHEPIALTMPGVGAPADESADIGIAEWVAAVADRIDQSSGPVGLVGHSGGGNVIYGAIDARPDRVARAVFVDTLPPPPGSMISEFEIVDGVVPFPGWDSFDAPDVADLDDQTRQRTALEVQDVPARVPTDGLALTNESRHRVPVTILSGALSESELRAAAAEWPGWAEELDALDDVEVVRLGSGHWPQFSQPAALADALVAAFASRRDQ